MTTLDLRIKRPLKSHSEAEWETWTSEHKVISNMMKNSGLEDKSIAIEAGIDPTILSKAKGGTARLNEAQMDALMDVTGSEAWLQYWMIKRGYDPRRMHRIESELERENRQLREKLAEVEAEREVEVRLFSKLRVAA
jgi:hypothetical protein